MIPPTAFRTMARTITMGVSAVKLITAVDGRHQR